MSRNLFLFPIGLMFGFAAGFLMAGSYGVTFDGHDHDTDHHAAQDTGARADASDGNGHAEHASRDVSDWPERPEVRLAAERDPSAGWNITIITENFRFLPPPGQEDDNIGSGHAHLYVNGTKLARVYGPWFHLDPLPPGRHIIRATLNTHDHRGLTAGGEEIAAEVELHVD